MDTNFFGRADMPSESDYLGIDKYCLGLSKYICSCETPMTISIQGRWGCGTNIFIC